jgi:CMP-N-acetylneuraminic acid synthetase
MRIFALIPARGGSKGIPRKNIRSIAGKPLIVWTIEAALGAKGIDTVVVSTDDEEIADVARAAGASVPFMRPAALAMDETAGIEPVLHALEMLPQYDAILLLQPTSPLRGTVEIDEVVSIAVEKRPPAIVSLCEAPYHPAWMFRQSANGSIERISASPDAIRRQDLEPVYTLNGAIYYGMREWLTKHRSFIGSETLAYTMPTEASIDIDEPLDWRIAELLLQEKLGRG